MARRNYTDGHEVTARDGDSKAGGDGGGGETSEGDTRRRHFFGSIITGDSKVQQGPGTQLKRPFLGRNHVLALGSLSFRDRKLVRTQATTRRGRALCSSLCCSSPCVLDLTVTPLLGRDSCYPILDGELRLREANGVPEASHPGGRMGPQTRPAGRRAPAVTQSCGGGAHRCCVSGR